MTKLITTHEQYLIIDLFNLSISRLFNHGIGIHLLQAENVPDKKSKINPKDNHISFQCTDVDLIIHQLEEMNVEYVKAVVKEGGIIVDQIFFHDPDGYMIEICNCQNLPLLPLSACPLKKMPSPNIHTSNNNSFYGESFVNFASYFYIDEVLICRF